MQSSSSSIHLPLNLHHSISNLCLTCHNVNRFNYFVPSRKTDGFSCFQAESLHRGIQLQHHSQHSPQPEGAICSQTCQHVPPRPAGRRKVSPVLPLSNIWTPGGIEDQRSKRWQTGGSRGLIPKFTVKVPRHRRRVLGSIPDHVEFVCSPLT